MYRYRWCLAFGCVCSLITNAEQSGVIAGYKPKSFVMDTASIDKDQASIETFLKSDNASTFLQARTMYTEGGHSLPIAVLTLAQDLTAGLSKGTQLFALTEEGGKISGQLHKDAYPGDKVLQFQYRLALHNDDNSLVCQVGALPVGEQNLEGCLRREGTLSVVERDKLMAYSYDPFSDNKSGRTLQSFSTDAKRLMYDCPTCPREDFLKFQTYYGRPDYADVWVTAAFKGNRTSFDNGNVDFSQMNLAGRGVAIKKGITFMGIWMYVIGQLEASLDNCTSGCVDCNSEAIQLLDQAVALYAGSQEGSDGSGRGFLIYDLADKCCADFRTCGKRQRGVTGTSPVNMEIFDLFSKSQSDILNGNCNAARAHKQRIVDLMTVPLIQGSLKSAHIADRQGSGAKEEAEAASFAASVLPIIHNCNPEDAKLIWENMASDFFKVKQAFERNYECLRITCKDVGGLYNTKSLSYYQYANPCHQRNYFEMFSVLNVISITLLSLTAAFLLTCCCLPLRRRRYIKKGPDMPPLPGFITKLEGNDDGWEELTIVSHFVL